ncbi:DPB4 [Candida oxycetoniae]|uniref:DNA polymerase epsilon subunit D n=1 Tax=Candida oxycetoniae TaxID=497107 RepID=A0AAI9SSI6_9ASCO|nr:DPB4 [Candida oxycetoniae]KAI3402388.2 DPB4 [Candida oxycetoniae]
MPPKGWKKNGDPSTTQRQKELELVSIEDILFPRSTLQKLAKTILLDEQGQNSMILAKDSMLALQRSATVFVSYLLFHARPICKDTGRKTVTAQDMMGALERAEFSGFIPEIKQKLGSFEAIVKMKRQKKLEEKRSLKEEEEEEEEEEEGQEGERDEDKAKRAKISEGKDKPGLVQEAESQASDDENVKGLESDEERQDDDIIIDEVEEDEGHVEDDIEDDIEEDDAGEEEEAVLMNPIAASSKDEDDLQGEKMEEEEEEEEEEGINQSSDNEEL